MRQIIIILALIALWPGYAFGQINQDTVNSDVPGGGGSGGGGLTESDINTPAKLNAFVTPDLADISSAQSLTNKTIDCNGNTCKPLRGTDCTTFDAATGGQYCVDTDDLIIYFCSVAEESVCDDPGEWVAVSSASTLAGLDDATITTPQDDDVLVYDTGEWVNKISVPLADSATNADSADGLSCTDCVALTTETSGNYVGNVATTSPLSGGSAGSEGASLTLTIANAAADGSTKGAASFTANDFDASSGNISIDYTNGQAASTSAKGFLTSTDWDAFTAKLDAADIDSLSELATLSNFTISGNTTVLGTTSGTLTSGDCVEFDANGNLVAAGSACGTGDGMPTSGGTFTGKIIEHVQALTIADSGDGNPATDSATEITGNILKVTCSDSDGCELTLAETNGVNGQVVAIENVSANALTLIETADVVHNCSSDDVLLAAGTILYYKYDTNIWNQQCSLANGFSSVGDSCGGETPIMYGITTDITPLCTANPAYAAADISFDNTDTNYVSNDVQNALGELSPLIVGVTINGTESIAITEPVTDEFEWALNFANHGVGDDVVMNAGEWVPAPNGFLFEGTSADGDEYLLLSPLGNPANTTNYFCLGNSSGEPLAYAAASIDGDDINSNIAGRSLTLNSGSPDTLDADPELYTDTKCANIDPAATTTSWFMFRAESAITVTGVDCIVDASTSVVLTPNECDGNGANCTAIEAAITCGTTNTTEASTIDNASIDAGDYIRVTRGTVTGSPTQAMICITYTKDD